MQFEREKFMGEMVLRENIRKIINLVKQKKKNAKKPSLLEGKQEEQLRSIIRKLILEATEEPTVSPHSSTGINILEDLLKKIIPVLEDDFKALTSDDEQRASFRAHIIQAVKNSLAPTKAMNAAEPGAGEEIKEEIDLDVEDDEKFIDINSPRGKPIEEPSDEEVFGIEGTDKTGRNLAYRNYKKIERNIIDAYDLLSNDDDRKLFYDYLITNLKLYFDKFDDELKTSMEEPTTPEYEEEAAAAAEATEAPAGTPEAPAAEEAAEEAPAGEEGIEELGL